ncbi:hypothetical protein [Egicoccus sp. AB-alg2]|uniref:hypothetical protein n=1 Tax=Egicoccus sp. AB-alg2 TaxID=3242693 RepID=UPI00359E3533
MAQHESANGGLDELGGPARTAAGQPTMDRGQVVMLVRRHVDLEHVRTGDYDDELWALWRDEAAGAGEQDHNADVLDRVLARLRTGG